MHFISYLPGLAAIEFEFKKRDKNKLYHLFNGSISLLGTR